MSLGLDMALPDGAPDRLIVDMLQAPPIEAFSLAVYRQLCPHIPT